MFQEKKFTMINFWSTSCVPCIVELPYIQQCSELYSSKLTILTVLYDSGESGAVERAKGIMASNGITLPALRRNDSIKAAFDRYLKSTALPVTLFFDENGKLIGEPHMGTQTFEQWKKTIEGIIGW